MFIKREQRLLVPEARFSKVKDSKATGYRSQVRGFKARYSMDKTYKI